MMRFFCNLIVLSFSLKLFFFHPSIQVVVASGAIKHEDIVEEVKKLFNNLSDDSTTASQLIAKEPTFFTGSEVRICNLVQLFIQYGYCPVF